MWRKKVRFWLYQDMFVFITFQFQYLQKQIAVEAHYLKVWMFFFFIRLLEPNYIFFREINFSQIKHCGGAHLRKNLLIQCVRRETSFFFPLFLLFRASFIADLFSICSTITPSFYNHFIFFLKDFFSFFSR